MNQTRQPVIDEGGFAQHPAGLAIVLLGAFPVTPGLLERGQSQPGVFDFWVALQYPLVHILGALLFAAARKHVGNVYPDFDGSVGTLQGALEHGRNPLGLARFQIDLRQLEIESPVTGFHLDQFFELLGRSDAVVVEMEQAIEEIAQLGAPWIEIQSPAGEHRGHTIVANLIVIPGQALVDGRRCRIQVRGAAQGHDGGIVVLLGFENLGLDKVRHGLLARLFTGRGRRKGPPPQGASTSADQQQRAQTDGDYLIFRHGLTTL